MLVLSVLFLRNEIFYFRFNLFCSSLRVRNSQLSFFDGLHQTTLLKVVEIDKFVQIYLTVIVWVHVPEQFICKFCKIIPHFVNVQIRLLFFHLHQ